MDFTDSEYEGLYWIYFLRLEIFDRPAVFMKAYNISSPRERILSSEQRTVFNQSANRFISQLSS
jgi:hypothetical protein